MTVEELDSILTKLENGTLIKEDILKKEVIVMNNELINITTNGYWYSNDCLYLDKYEYKTEKIIEFDEFKRHYNYWDLKTEWDGNNPFTRSDCLGFWINDNSRVEIRIFTRKYKTEFSIYKVIDSQCYHETNKLMIDLIKLEELYRYLMKQFEEYKEEYILGDSNE